MSRVQVPSAAPTTNRSGIKWPNLLRQSQWFPMSLPDKLPEGAFKGAESVLLSLGLPDGFLWSLYGEGDWSFIIKCSALLEAGLLRALKGKFEQFSIDSHLDSLTHFKRIQLAIQSKAIPKELERGLKHIADVRNSLVHDISCVSF